MVTKAVRSVILCAFVAVVSLGLATCADDEGSNILQNGDPIVLDTVPDTIPGTPPDTTPGTVPDTIPDNPLDTTPSTVPDTIPDTPPDTIPGTVPDTIPDNPLDTTPSTVPDTIINYDSLEQSGSTVFLVDMPDEMHFSADGRMLLTGRPVRSGLYDSAQIRTIRLYFSQGDYWEQMLYNKDNEIDDAMVLADSMSVGNLSFSGVGVSFRGNRSFHDPRDDGSRKLPFQIAVDYSIENQDLMGYQTLNLNNKYLDPSFIREVFYRRQIRKHIPAAKTSFVRLYINGQDWGLYTSTQQLNKDFLREWFFNEDGARWRAEGPDGPRFPRGGPGAVWSDGYSALSYLGSSVASYQQYYTLRTDVTIVDNPWQRLVDAARAIDDTPIEELSSVVGNYLDVDRTLWFLASEIVFTDQDGYVHKGQDDYFIYYDPATGWITPLEFDANEVMGTGTATQWSPFYNSNSPNYPLLYKLLAVDEYRQRYLAHLRTIINESLDPSQTDIIIDNLRFQIESHVHSDPIKLHTNAQFTSGVEALKTFVRQRRTFLLSNSEVAQVAPVIESVTLYNSEGVPWAAPTMEESVTITANVTGDIREVNLYYSTSLAGAFRSLDMQEVSTGQYTIDIPPLRGGSFFRFYVEAVSNNSARSVSYSPPGAEHDVYVFRVQ